MSERAPSPSALRDQARRPEERAVTEKIIL